MVLADRDGCHGARGAGRVHGTAAIAEGSEMAYCTSIGELLMHPVLHYL
ncbi:MAG: hypothetical protein SFW36_05495 [Leptolyngbyaceae cyanobacterium bins.59]|nr:hypothetical protein [Leptolyngbyaceae cyanobacterium bins.59]